MPCDKYYKHFKQKICSIDSRQINGEQKRFGELLKEVGNISPRTLSKRLKELEKAGLVRKRQFNETPPRVEYNLTVSGKDLIKCFKSLNEWAKKWGS